MKKEWDKAVKQLIAIGKEHKRPVYLTCGAWVYLYDPVENVKTEYSAYMEGIGHTKNVESPMDAVVLLKNLIFAEIEKGKSTT